MAVYIKFITPHVSTEPDDGDVDISTTLYALTMATQAYTTSDFQPGTECGIYYTSVEITGSVPLTGGSAIFGYTGSWLPTGEAVFGRLVDGTLDAGTEYTWTCKVTWATAPAGDSTSDVFTFTTAGTALSKPTTPTPADDSGPGINFATRTLSWVNGGGATSYTVRIGPYPIAYNVVSEDQAGTSYVIPEDDIALYKDNPITWRVDASDGVDTVTGDTWTFDPRPAKVTTPVPADAAEDQSLNLAAISWAASTYATSYVAYPSWYGGVSGIATAGTSITLADYTPATMDRLEHGDTYTWIVDAVNQWGTTEGDEWSFDTLAFDPPVTSWANLPGMTLGPLDGGVEGIDFYYHGVNFMTAVRRVVAAAADSIWYEDIG